MNTSPVRELIWLEIQKNPLSSAKDIKAALGLKSTINLRQYLTALYRARLIDRESRTEPSNNACGVVHYYVYRATSDTFKWKSGKIGRPNKPSKPTKRIAAAHKVLATPTSVLTSEFTRQTVIKAATNDVDLILKQLPLMSLRDVLRLRDGINEALQT